MGRKRETRLLVYALGKYYGVFATYRRDFLEELTVTRVLNVLNLDIDKYLEKNMRTYDEITYTIPCNENKYSTRLNRFKVLEGGEEIVARQKYCKLVSTLLCMLESRGLISSLSMELIVELSDSQRWCQHG